MDNQFKKAEASNKKLWNELAPVHFKSYDVDGFRTGKTALDKIQLQDLGDVNGKTFLHLQCHFGHDTLSWEREGAIVTGIDFSDKSIELAEQLRDELKMKTRFICCNVYDLKEHLNEQFDIVYTSQGVLCWLKDIDAWGKLVFHFLKPGGRFYIMESHPTSHIFDDEQLGMNVKYSYFHRAEPTVWDDEWPDYSDENYITKNPSFEWQWSLGDIVNALINAGLKVEFLNEYDKLFYKGFPEMIKDNDGWWVLPEYRDKIPLTFTLMCKK